MIRLPPGIPGPDRSHRLLGPRLAAVPTAPVTHEPADLLPQPPEQVPSRDSVILELSTSALKERMALLLERFVPKGWTVLGIGREQGFLAQALAERSPAVGPVDFLAFGDTADPAGALGPMVMIEPVDAVVLDDDVMGLPGPERSRLIGQGLGALRPGGRLLLVVSDAGTGLWAEGLTSYDAEMPDQKEAESPAPFGRTGLTILHRDGCDLGARSCVELVLELPWPAWIAALPVPVRERYGRKLWRLRRRIDRLRTAWPRLRWRLIELLKEEDEDG
ncbi:hypothetical protein [Benzoatithermus flavus]|uniref:Class I SAM-dependent methyltransferase n=1 Tax=Benzoatithermus flavus TaxID=3108223 RepID=A0ABU8XUV0_9PROT